MRAPPFRLLIVSDGGPELAARIERALTFVEPGWVAVQLRERTLSSGALLTLARTLRTLTERRGALLLINDRVDVALACGAEGVQLPEAGFAPATARALLGPNAWIGASRHDSQGLVQAAAAGADFATLSPVHALAGKAPPLGIAGFGELARAAPLPLYALGGVRLEDVPQLLRAGAYGVAVMREVLSARDPAESTRQLLASLRASAACR